RIECTQHDDLANLRDRALRRRRHDGSEIARGLAVDEISPAVAAVGFDQREIGMNRVLEHIVAPADLACFLALGEQRSIGGRREDGADAGTCRADPLGEIALRHELELDLARAVEWVEYIGVDLPWERADDLAHAPRLEERRNAGLAVAGVVVNDRQVARA